MNEAPKNLKEALGEIIFALGEYYDKKLTATQIEMYVEDLMVLSPEQLTFAVRKYRTIPENHFFPLPAKLIALVTPKENTELDLGREVAGRIIQAVSKFGQYLHEEAKEFIGQVGWKVVERQGGWSNVCSELNNDNKGMLQAQMRDLAISIMRMGSNGTLDAPIGIPQGPMQKQIGELVNKFSDKKAIGAAT